METHEELLLAITLALLPVGADAAKKEAPVENFKLDVAASSAKWEAAKVVGGGHTGELKFKSGEFTAKGEALTGGSAEIDMTSLKDSDLGDGSLNAKLVGHLKSDDFFSVEKHPTSTFKITKVEGKGAKTTITGDLTIKGITKPITFPASVTADKKALKATGTMTVDRTQFDIKFRSAKFFSDLGDKVIKDSFTVAFSINATK